MLAVNITNEQKVTITLKPVTATGKPATLDGPPTWTVKDGESAVNPTEDGLSAEIVSSDTPGTTTILLPRYQVNETPILPESQFGRVLTRLAMKSNTIVEIGCGGIGSTLSLAKGLVRPDQRMWSIDINPVAICVAALFDPEKRITFLCGTVLKPEECALDAKALCGQSRLKSISSANLQGCASEMAACANLPYIGDQLPDHIDLLLLDGGKFASRFEYLKLFKRCRVIALDDTRQDIGLKNFQNHLGMRTPLGSISWKLLFNRPFERRGWSVFCRTPQRVKGKMFPACRDENDIDQALE